MTEGTVIGASRVPRAWGAFQEIAPAQPSRKNPGKLCKAARQPPPHPFPPLPLATPGHTTLLLPGRPQRPRRSKHRPRCTARSLPQATPPLPASKVQGPRGQQRKQPFLSYPSSLPPQRMCLRFSNEGSIPQSQDHRTECRYIISQKPVVGRADVSPPPAEAPARRSEPQPRKLGERGGDQRGAGPPPGPQDTPSGALLGGSELGHLGFRPEPWACRACRLLLGLSFKQLGRQPVLGRGCRGEAVGEGQLRQVVLRGRGARAVREGDLKLGSGPRGLACNKRDGAQEAAEPGARVLGAVTPLTSTSHPRP